MLGNSAFGKDIVIRWQGRRCRLEIGEICSAYKDLAAMDSSLAEQIPHPFGDAMAREVIATLIAAERWGCDPSACTAELISCSAPFGLGGIFALFRHIKNAFKESQSANEAGPASAPKAERRSASHKHKGTQSANRRRAKPQRQRPEPAPQTPQQAKQPWWAEELGITLPTTRQHLRKAFVILALRHHPDHGGCAKAFAKINAAWETAQLQVA